MRRHLLLGAISFVLQMGTLFIPRTVDSRDGLASVGLGYPISFAVQNFSRLDPPSFPRRYSLLTPLEFPLRFELVRSLLAFGSILATLEVATRVLLRRRR